MKISEDGLRLIEKSEGYASHAYQDQGGVWTIGYGHTHDVEEGDIITLEIAEGFLKQDVTHAELSVESAVEVDLEQHEFDALVSFVFNLGVTAFKGSTLLAKLNQGDKVGAAGEFMLWHNVNHRPVRGLALRRWREAGLFLGIWRPA